MTDLEKYLSELLFTHDCVILPDFGGFILHTSSGKYITSSQLFSPPSRTVSFNQLLKADDGLLISTVAEKKGIPYSEGKKLVMEYIALLQARAASTDGAVIRNIGTFRSGREGKLQFIPDPGANYLASSFGLLPVHAQAATNPKRATRTARGRASRIDRKPAPVKTRTPAPVKWTVITSIPVILFLLWGIVFPANFQHHYTNYSGIFTSFFSKPESLPLDKPETSANGGVNTEILNGGMPEKSKGIEAAPETIYSEQEAVTPAATTGSDGALDQPESKIYHVIGGVFSNKENALGYVSALVSRGYNARLVGANRKGQFRVCYDSYESWALASSFLETIKAKENPSAWILKY